ncbi:sigma-E processing peptidase SpoIIGA [Bacillus andreraoultii]|uniref:sigma-E processing peptidase SpoIIGA n=1 Tax=Bacillus andreraoultii TaxID=1499685 RepID=UPI00053A928E|nr:sigma-E processing peptidase SpoIIGA [Bacillus andreraoultii]
MTVYLDIIWLLNFLFDSLLLYLTGLILKRKITKLRIFIGGFIGSLIVFAPFTAIATLLSSPFIKVCISILMVWVAFGFKRLRFIITNLLSFYLVTFTTGGALIGLHYLLSFRFDVSNTFMLAQVRGFGDPISWLFVALAFPLVLYFSRRTIDSWETRKIQYDQLIDVDITINNQTIRLKGLIDSGNQLYDPLTKKPVVIVSLEKTANIFPEEVLAVFQDVNKIWKEDYLPMEWVHKISIIPYRVVGKENQLMAAVKPEEVVIHDGDEAYHTNRLLLAFVNQKLSSEDSFDCIIHPKILQQSDHEQVS